MALAAPAVSMINYLAQQGEAVTIVSFHTTADSFDSQVEVVNLRGRLFRTDAVGRKVDRIAAHQLAYTWLAKNHGRFKLIWITAWQYSKLPQYLRVIGYKGKTAYQFRELELDKLRYLKHFDFVLMPERNRMWIAYFLGKLEREPLFLPNIPFLPALGEPTPEPLIEQLRSRGQRVLLYQGLVEFSKRCISELLQGLKLGPEEFHLIVMASASSKAPALKRMRQEVKDLGLTERVHELPTRMAPEHLQIVRQADVGIGLYRPTSLNQVYAAPNRLHEFAAFNIPLILPAFPSFTSLAQAYPYAVNVVDPEQPEDIARVLGELNQETNLATGRANSEMFRVVESDYSKFAGQAWATIKAKL